MKDNKLKQEKRELVEEPYINCTILAVLCHEHLDLELLSLKLIVSSRQRQR